MYDLNTRGRLLILSADDHSLIRVVSEDVSVADAFVIIDQLLQEDPQVRHDFDHGSYDMPAWVYVIVPVGVDWDPSSGEDPYELVMWHMRSCDTSTEVDGFGYGPESGLDECEEVGFSPAVWRDGQAHPGWFPAD